MRKLKSIVYLSVLLLAASVQANVIWSQDFNGYADGTELNTGGNTTPTGFGGSWYNGSGQITVTSGVAQGSGYSMADLGNTLGNTTVGSTGTLWLSFDWQHVSSNSGGVWGGLTFFEGSSTEKGKIGNDWDNPNWSGTGVSNIGMKTGVAKIELSSTGNETVSLWVGAAGSPVDVRGPAMQTITGWELSSVNNIRILGNNDQQFDNLVIATTAIEVGAITYDTAFNADTTGSWTNAANWTDGEPSASDSACVLGGAVATLDSAANIKSLTVVGAATLDIADGGVLTASSDVTFVAGSTNRVGIGSGTSCGKLSVGGTLNVSGATLVINGTIDGDGRTIAVATNGIAGTFSNFGRGALVQSGTPNYYLHYVTNASPNYIMINQKMEWAAADDFSYADGGLNGQNGGTGFSGAWSSSINVTGGVATGNDPSFRIFSTAFPSSGTLWVSFDWGNSAKPTEDGSYGGLTFFVGASEKFLIGNTWPTVGHDKWSMNGVSPTTELNYPGMKTAVVKITLGAGATSTVELWVGTAGSPVDVSGAALATVTGRELAGVDRIRINGGDFGGGGNNQSFDNLVIATTAAAVGAVDHPKGTLIILY
ncbi:MAG: hypothetical protein WCK89_11345 [bacterium]